jgi:zinc transporter ZupT
MVSCKTEARDIEEELNRSGGLSLKTRILDGLGALLILVGTLAAAVWVGKGMASTGVNVWHVLVASTITAIATGFGALPFLIFDRFKNGWLNIGNSLAAGLMLGASVGLLIEGSRLERVEQPILRLGAGVLLGGILIALIHHLLEDRKEEFHIGNVQGADAIQMLMIVGVMTAHSFAEGVGVGVAFGDGESLGGLISVAIAIHNVPEGLAISLVLIPRGTSVIKASLWSIFSSLPQPLMAVPAFLFVLKFRPFLPVGLGLAAGAMFWMVFKDLLPEALEGASPWRVYPVAGTALAAMLGFQYWFG